MKPKTFTEDLVKSLEANPMGDMLVHRPAFQIMEVLCSPLVPAGEKPLLAFRALVQDTGACNDLPVDPALGQFQVVCELCMGWSCRTHNFRSTAQWAFIASDRDRSINSHSPSLLLPSGSRLPNGTVCTQEDLLPLIVKVRTGVNMLEVRDYERRFSILLP